MTRCSFGVRRQSEAATARWAARDVQERQTLPGPERCRASLATALQSGLPETARQTLSLALRGGFRPLAVVKLLYNSPWLVSSSAA